MKARSTVEKRDAEIARLRLKISELRALILDMRRLVVGAERKSRP